MDRKLANIELGRIKPADYQALPPSGVVLVLDNIRSAHNVGSAFRTADAFQVDEVFLCGICACPPSAEIHKAALGAELSMRWEHCEYTLAVVEELHKRGFRVLAVEQTQNAVELQKFAPRAGEKLALVFGNEVDGVQQEVVDACDGALIIPQFGTKHSLNVSVSVGVALWQIVSKSSLLNCE